VEQITSKLHKQSARRFGYAIVIVMVVGNLAAITLLSETAFRYTDKFRSISPLMQFPLRVERVAAFLDTRLGRNQAVILDNYNCEPGIMAVAAGLSEDRVYLGTRIHNYTCEDTLPVDAARFKLQYQELWTYISSRRPEFVVYSDRGSLKPYLPLPSSCKVPAAIDGIQFECVYQDDVYRIYKLAYQASPTSISSLRGQP
jgi:hypothetical protein